MTLTWLNNPDAANPPMASAWYAEDDSRQFTDGDRWGTQ